MILEDFQWHTWPCPITVSKQFNLYKGRRATSDTGSHSRLTPKLPPLLRLRFVPNPNYVASNPGGIPKSQISLRSTPTTTAGADNLTLLSFISLCGQTGTNYSRAPFSPTLFPPSFSASCSAHTGTSHKQHHLANTVFPSCRKVGNVCQFASSILHQPVYIVIRIVTSRL